MSDHIHECVHCGKPATLSNPDSGEPLCLLCAADGLEYGHRHCHDDPEDCESEFEVIGGNGATVVLRCPHPVEA